MLKVEVQWQKKDLKNQRDAVSGTKILKTLKVVCFISFLKDR